MRIFVFGSSITSSYWNGAATYYRGIYKALAALGYEITFAEPDIFNRQQNRDLSEVDYAKVIVYQTPQDIDDLIDLAATADLVIKHSGVGSGDDLLERRVLDCHSSHTQVAFWDVDAPATLQRVEGNPFDPFRRCIPRYDFIFHLRRRTGGRAALSLAGGAQLSSHLQRSRSGDASSRIADPAMSCDLVFVGNRLPDRERRVEQFFLRAAELAPEMRFILGGEGGAGKSDARQCALDRTRRHRLTQSY